MRPDYAASWLVGTWQAPPSPGTEETDCCLSISAAADGTYLWEEDNAKWRLRAIAWPGDGRRALVEMQIAEIDGQEVANGWSMLAVLAARERQLAISAVRGDMLAEQMQQDGHSGHFVQSWFVTEVDADTDDLLETLARHETELLGPAIFYGRAVAN